MWDSTDDVLGLRCGFHRDFLERDGDCDSSANARVAGERAAEHFDALAHTAQSVAFALEATLAVVFDFKMEKTVALLKAQATGLRVGVADYVGDGLLDGHRQDAFLHGWEFQRGCCVPAHCNSGGLERIFG